MHIKNVVDKLKLYWSYFKKARGKNVFLPSYRVVEIIQEDDEQYVVEIQLIHKNLIFKAKPEELLAKDEIVDQFSPRDIRTLTYLGYLGINSPKYKILANRLLEKDNKLVFAIKKKGQKSIITKTADEIFKEQEVLESLSPKDAHLVGFTIASESAAAEKRQKEAVLKNLEIEQNKNGDEK